ncbi:M42 family peptidase [Clostridium rectalis]|uniref:M42 family peptidase n=1 Tax=Clostridium rectalis TaxID=2040295 RepID=UPI000F63807F|nr:M42 family peptidase [Clostridium rectalis]
MDKLLSELINTFGVSGNEEFVRSIILEVLKDKEYDIKEDKMGNLIVKVGNGSKKIMICTHMDQIGFIVSYIEDNGFIRVEKLGNFKTDNISHSYIRFKNGSIGKIIINKDDMYIDIGAKNKEEVNNKIKIGDTACLVGPCLEVENNNIISPNLDNRIGCYVLLKLLMDINTLNKETYFVFSSQKLMGNRGARAAAYEVDPNYCIVLDVKQSSDSLSGKNSFKLGNGPGINIMDKTLIMHEDVKSMIEMASSELNLRTQNIILDDISEGGVIHKERNGIKTGELCIPCRYKNSSSEMVNFDDVNGCIKLLKKILE